MIPVDPHDCCCDLAEEGAALGLLGLMTGISEENWAAGWMDGLEHELWKFVTGERTGHYGMNTITERQTTLLRLLSEECNGWWIHDEGPKFVRRERWLTQLAVPATVAEPEDSAAEDR